MKVPSGSVRSHAHEAQDHRQGLSPQRHLRRPFEVVLFEDDVPEGSRKVGIVFEEQGYIPRQACLMGFDFQVR
jgi:hypothetical protein